VDGFFLFVRWLASNYDMMMFLTTFWLGFWAFIYFYLFFKEIFVLIQNFEGWDANYDFYVFAEYALLDAFL